MPIIWPNSRYKYNKLPICYKIRLPLLITYCMWNDVDSAKVINQNILTICYTINDSTKTFKTKENKIKFGSWPKIYNFVSRIKNRTRINQFSVRTLFWETRPEAVSVLLKCSALTKIERLNFAKSNHLRIFLTLDEVDRNSYIGQGDASIMSQGPRL